VFVLGTDIDIHAKMSTFSKPPVLMELLNSLSESVVCGRRLSLSKSLMLFDGRGFPIEVKRAE